MQDFGPICRQRFPFPIGQKERDKKSSEQFELQLALMRRLMPSDSFARSSALIRQLAQMEQSEDCLNLNVYAPLESKYNSRSQPKFK